MIRCQIQSNWCEMVSVLASYFYNTQAAKSERVYSAQWNLYMQPTSITGTFSDPKGNHYGQFQCAYMHPAPLYFYTQSILDNDFDPNRYIIFISFTNVLEGLLGEYHSSSVALGNVLSCQSLLSRVLAGPLAYQVVAGRIQCSTSSGLLSTDFNTLRR